MTNTELRKELEELADRIISRAITPKQAVEINAYLDELCPYGTEAGAICQDVMIATGAGECLYTLMSLRALEEQFETI